MKRSIWILIFTISTSVLGNDFDNFYFRFYDGLVIFKSEYYDLENRKVGIASGSSTSKTRDDGRVLIQTFRIILPDLNQELTAESEWTKISDDHYVFEFSNSNGEKGSGDHFLLPNNRFKGEVIFENGAKSIVSGKVENDHKIVIRYEFISPEGALYLTATEKAIKM